jgi:hypothetical protein
MNVKLAFAFIVVGLLVCLYTGRILPACLIEATGRDIALLQALEPRTNAPALAGRRWPLLWTRRKDYMGMRSSHLGTSVQWDERK